MSLYPRLLPVRHISVSIARPLAQVYGFLAEPANFPLWAEGLGDGLIPLGGRDYSVDTPLGTMMVRFSAPNEHGVLDHTLFPADGAPMDNPMRVVANGEGSEVVFTLFRRPGMSEEAFAADADWVARDLARLKALLEDAPR